MSKHRDLSKVLGQNMWVVGILLALHAVAWFVKGGYFLVPVYLVLSGIAFYMWWKDR